MPKESDEEICQFAPSRGDVLLELKGGKLNPHVAKEQVFAWRMIARSSKDPKAVWPKPVDPRSECPHEDVLWAIDSKIRFISLCEECGEFEFGHKVSDKNE